MQDRIAIQPQIEASEYDHDYLERQQHFNMTIRKSQIETNTGNQEDQKDDSPLQSKHDDELPVVEDIDDFKCDTPKNVFKRQVPRIDMTKVQINENNKDYDEGMPTTVDVDDSDGGLLYSKMKKFFSKSVIQSNNVKNSERNNKKNIPSQRGFEGDKATILKSFNSLEKSIKNPVYNLLQLQEQDKFDQLIDIFQTFSSITSLNNINIAHQKSIIKTINNKTIQSSVQQIIKVLPTKEDCEIIRDIFSIFNGLTQQQRESIIKVIDPNSLRQTGRQHNIVTPRKTTQPNIFQHSTNDPQYNSDEEYQDKKINANYLDEYLKTCKEQDKLELLKKLVQNPALLSYVKNEFLDNDINVNQENLNDNGSEIHLIQGGPDNNHIQDNEDNKNEIDFIQPQQEKSDLVQKVTTQNNILAYIYAMATCRKKASKNEENKQESLEIVPSQVDGSATNKSIIQTSIRDALIEEINKINIENNAEEKKNLIHRLKNCCSVYRNKKVSKVDSKNANLEVIPSQVDAKVKFEETNSRNIYALITCRRKTVVNDENKKETLEVIEENQNAIKDKLIQEIKAKNNRDEMDNKKKNPCCSFRNFLSSQSSHNSKKTEGVKID